MVSSMREQIDGYIARVKLFLSRDDWESEQFASELDSYFTDFANSQDELLKASKNSLEATNLREPVAELMQLQDTLLSRLEKGKDVTIQALGEVGKRHNALKNYINQYPARITVAGSRKV
jgi:hypothetical protein